MWKGPFLYRFTSMKSLLSLLLHQLSFSSRHTLPFSWVFHHLTQLIASFPFCFRFQVLAPRVGYLPLVISLVKPQFSSMLPHGLDTVWFDYNGFPLKWCDSNTMHSLAVFQLLHYIDCFLFYIYYVFCRCIPTGILSDLLCMELERLWNLTVITF